LPFFKKRQGDRGPKWGKDPALTEGGVAAIARHLCFPNGGRSQKGGSKKQQASPACGTTRIHLREGSNKLGGQSVRMFNTRCRAINRIGPHNIDIISIVFGLLLGDGFASNRTGEGVRIAIKQSEVHKEYLFFLYYFFYDRGYCTNLEPRKYTRFIKGIDRLYFGYEFNTYTFRSLSWIYKSFYKNGRKIVPYNIERYMNELTLSIWIMDDGG
jgi:hypothetical protein